MRSDIGVHGGLWRFVVDHNGDEEERFVEEGTLEDVDLVVHLKQVQEQGQCANKVM